MNELLEKMYRSLKKVPMRMAQWAIKLDAFLEFNDQNVLTNAGKISHKVAQQLAESEYEKFVEIRRVEQTNEVSDFDELVDKQKQLTQKK